jgi:hypothetical protein
MLRPSNLEFKPMKYVALNNRISLFTSLSLVSSQRFTSMTASSSSMSMLEVVLPLGERLGEVWMDVALQCFGV